MPTLSRFAMTLAIVVLVIYAAMFALATLVKPRQGEMSVPVPPQKLQPAPAVAP